MADKLTTAQADGNLKAFNQEYSRRRRVHSDGLSCAAAACFQ